MKRKSFIILFIIVIVSSVSLIGCKDNKATEKTRIDAETEKTEEDIELEYSILVIDYLKQKSIGMKNYIEVRDKREKTHEWLKEINDATSLLEKQVDDFLSSSNPPQKHKVSHGLFVKSGEELKMALKILPDALYNLDSDEVDRANEHLNTYLIYDKKANTKFENE